MNTTELVEKVVKDTGLTKKDAKAAVESVFENIKKETKKPDGVRISGFGTFSKVRKKARKGRNPIDGSVVKIKARTVPKFKPSKTFKDIFLRKK